MRGGVFLAGSGFFFVNPLRPATWPVCFCKQCNRDRVSKEVGRLLEREMVYVVLDFDSASSTKIEPFWVIWIFCEWVTLFCGLSWSIEVTVFFSLHSASLLALLLVLFCFLAFCCFYTPSETFVQTKRERKFESEYCAMRLIFYWLKTLSFPRNLETEHFPGASFQDEVRIAFLQAAEYGVQSGQVANNRVVR